MNSTSTQDPFAPFPTWDTANKHKPPAAPEPSTYGFLFVGFCLLLLGWKRFRR